MKSEFLTELKVQKLKKDGTWQVIEDFIYRSHLLGRTVTVPAGFVTDFASVPRLPLVYLATGNTAQEAAVIHDYLYQAHSVSRKHADQVFKEAMKASKVSWWRRSLMYFGVRVGGGGAYSDGVERIQVLGNAGVLKS